MAEKQFHRSFLGLLTDRLVDLSVTLVCWTWFVFGFFIFFSWRYVAAVLAAKDPEISFQRLNSQFFHVLFCILNRTAPSHQVEIDPGITAIRSSVLVCNHLSYLDPLLLVRIFKRQRTIVKARFFSMPIFGWIIRKSGYLPAAGEGRLSRLLISRMETMEPYLKSGGNLFVFPEGTRSRDGKIGELQRGALKIARICKAPIYVLQISNTDRLFTPGQFLFNTRIKNTIKIKIVACIDPDYQASPPSIGNLEQQVLQAYCEDQQ